MMTDENGQQGFYPAIVKPDGTVGENPGYRDVVDEYIGDLGYCRPRTQERKSFDCTALHNGKEVRIQQLPVVADPSAASLAPIPSAKSAGGTQPAASMVNVAVDLYGYRVTAMVDSDRMSRTGRNCPARFKNSSSVSGPSRFGDPAER